MKKITRITTQQKKKNRYNIFLDDQYAFSVDEAVLVEFRLRKGLELSDETIEKLTQKDKFYQFYTQSIHYLSYRMRTKKEMVDYLTKKEADPETIEEIIHRLENEKLLNDQEFAEMFIRTRINTSTKGPKLIEQELMKKGVSPKIIFDCLVIYDNELQFDKIYKFMEKKLKQSSKHSFRKRMEQIKMNLLQKGFSRGLIEEVAQEFADVQDDAEEWEAVCYQGEKMLRKFEKKYSGFDLKNKMKEGLYRKGFNMDLINRFLEEYVEKE